MIYCAGKIESFAFAKSIGVGLVESAINLTQSVLFDKPDEIVFVGTCGSYSTAIPLLEVFESYGASNIELSFLEDKSYTPLDNILTNLATVSRETILNPHSNATQKIVNSSNYISTDSTLAQKMLKLGIAYENMEFFSVLKVANHFNLPAIGIFCSTNYIHKNAREEFLSNHKAAMQKLESYVKNKLDSTLGA